MNILVDATALRSAGGWSVGNGFLHGLRGLGCTRHKVKICVPDGNGYETSSDDYLSVCRVPAKLSSDGMRMLRERWVMRQVYVSQPDIIFNMGNLALPVHLPQLLMVHWPYAVYPDSEVWSMMGFRNKMQRVIRRLIFKNRLRFATAVTVQTENMTRRICLHTDFNRSVYMVPSALPIEEEEARVSIVNDKVSHCISGPETKLLCLSRFYPHKNLQVLLSLSRIIKDYQAPFRIIVTVAPEQNTEAGAFLKAIDDNDVGDVLFNIGPVPSSEVPALYQQVDGAIMPTLLESFGLTYLEAFYFNCPVFTSDRDFARAVCRDAAFYFDPHDAGDIFSTLVKAYDNVPELKRRKQIGRQLIAEMPKWSNVAAMYLTIMENIVGSEA